MSDRLTALIDSLDQKSEATLRELDHVRKRLQLLEGENSALKEQLEQQQAATPVVAREVSVAGGALADAEPSRSPVGDAAPVTSQPHAAEANLRVEDEPSMSERDSVTEEKSSASQPDEGDSRGESPMSEQTSELAEAAETKTSHDVSASPQQEENSAAAPSEPPPSPQALLKHWYSQYPNAFFTAHTKPLKIGIHEDLIAREPWPAKLIRRALANYVNLPRYLKSVRVGVQRVDLDGQPAGDIGEQDVQHAREQLTALQKHRREREEKVKAERMARKLAELNARLGH